MYFSRDFYKRELELAEEVILKLQAAKTELQQKVELLENSIRKHRDCKGHARCWEDDNELYSVLPEGNTGDQSLPSRQEFLAGCERYYELRRSKPKDLVDLRCKLCEGKGCDDCQGSGHV